MGLGFISQLWRSCDEGKVVGELLGGMEGWWLERGWSNFSSFSHTTTSQKPGAGLGKAPLEMFLTAQR